MHEFDRYQTKTQTGRTNYHNMSQSSIGFHYQERLHVIKKTSDSDDVAMKR
jgi:hypothetical protein